MKLLVLVLTVWVGVSAGWKPYNSRYSNSRPNQANTWNNGQHQPNSYRGGYGRYRNYREDGDPPAPGPEAGPGPGPEPTNPPPAPEPTEPPEPVPTEPPLQIPDDLPPTQECVHHICCSIPKKPARRNPPRPKPYRSSYSQYRKPRPWRD